MVEGQVLLVSGGKQKGWWWRKKGWWTKRPSEASVPALALKVERVAVVETAAAAVVAVAWNW